MAQDPEKRPPHLVIDVYFRINDNDHTKNDYRIELENLSVDGLFDYIEGIKMELFNEIIADPESFNFDITINPEEIMIVFFKAIIKQSFHNPDLKEGREIYTRESLPFSFRHKDTIEVVESKIH